MSGAKGITGMHRFNICLVVVLLWCENTIILRCVVPMAGQSGVGEWKPQILSAKCLE